MRPSRSRAAAQTRSLVVAPRTWAFDNFSDLVDEVSARVVSRLERSVQQAGGTSLAAPGGVTPLLLFDGLCGRDAPWADTRVTLTDERRPSRRSVGLHEAAIRRRLLRGRAAAARFVPTRAWSGPIDTLLLGVTEGGDVGGLGRDPSGVALSFQTLLNAGWIGVVIRGEAKLGAYRRALTDCRCETSLRALLEHRGGAPFHVFWAP